MTQENKASDADERERAEFVYRMASIARHPPLTGSFPQLDAIVQEIQEAARREERKRCAELVGHELADDGNECRPLCPACRIRALDKEKA